MTTALQLDKAAPRQFRFVVDENYLRLVTRAELRRRFRNPFAYLRPALWLIIGMWSFSAFAAGTRWAIAIVAVNAVLLYIDTIGLLFSYPRQLASNTPVGSVVEVGFGERTLTQRNGDTTTTNSLGLASIIIRSSGLLVLLYTDGVHTYYPDDLIPQSDVDQINRQLAEFHRR